MKGQRTIKRYPLCSLLLLVALLPACASEQGRSEARIDRLMASQACPHWSLDVEAPIYMEAWVEDLVVKDDRGYWSQIPQGMASSLGQTAGWPPPYRVLGSGSARLDSTGLPMEVSLRWQSLAEPQTYTWHFIVPESLRQAMAKKEPTVWLGKPSQGCRSDITVGVAPGGRTIVWISGIALTPAIEVMRGKAEVEPLGPYQGFSKGKYRPMHEPARKYVEEHGIPYGSWDH
jgi:hypothetical protein